MEWIARLLGRELSWRLGRALYIHARDESGNLIASNGEAALIAAAWRARDTQRPFVAFDVGGNLGDWSAAMLATAGDAPLRLEIFDPTPAAADRLRARFAGDTRVTVNQVALSGESGSATLYLVGETAGTNSLTAMAEGGSTITVPTVTLDDHLAARGLDHVDLLKIDIEGHDIVVLRGLGPVLAAERIDVIQFEYNHRWLGNAGSLREVFALIEGTGYALARVAPQGLRLIERWNPEIDRYFEANYALVRRARADALGAQAHRWSESNILVPA